MSAIAGAAEAVVMPAMHRAFQKKCPGALLRALNRRAAGFVGLAMILVLLAAWQINDHSGLGVMILLAPMPLLAAFSSINIGVLNAEGKHRQAVLGPLYGGLISIPLVFVLPSSAYSLASVLLMFELGRAFGLWLQRSRYKPSGSHEAFEADSLISWASRGAKLQAIGSLLLALNPLIDVLFANYLGTGAVTKIEYANRLWNIVPLLFSGQITIAYAGMSRMASRNHLDYKRVHTTALKLGSMAALLSLVVIALSSLIVDMLYGFGKMAEVDRATLTQLLVCYLIGTGPFVGSLVYVRGLSSEGRIDIITSVAGFGVLINIASNALLIRLFGLNGIGLATSITYSTNALLLAYLFGIEGISHHKKQR